MPRTRSIRKYSRKARLSRKRISKRSIKRSRKLNKKLSRRQRGGKISNIKSLTKKIKTLTKKEQRIQLQIENLKTEKQKISEKLKQAILDKDKIAPAPLFHSYKDSNNKMPLYETGTHPASSQQYVYLAQKNIPGIARYPIDSNDPFKMIKNPDYQSNNNMNLPGSQSQSNYAYE